MLTMHLCLSQMSKDSVYAIYEIILLNSFSQSLIGGDPLNIFLMGRTNNFHAEVNNNEEFPIKCLIL